MSVSPSGSLRSVFLALRPGNMPHTRPHARSQGLAKGRARTRALLWAEVPWLPHRGAGRSPTGLRGHPMGAQDPIPVARFLTAVPKASPVGPPSPSGACAVCLGWKQTPKPQGEVGGVYLGEVELPATLSCLLFLLCQRRYLQVSPCDGQL